MKASKTFPLNTFPICQYVVILSRMDGGWLFSRHRERDTWETQGGHIEAGEVADEAARRELWEESGAVDFDLHPLCDYWAGDERGSAVGRLYLAEIHRLGPLPESEMAKVRRFDTVPDKLTYPWITPTLVEEAERYWKGETLR